MHGCLGWSAAGLTAAQGVELGHQGGLEAAEAVTTTARKCLFSLGCASHTVGAVFQVGLVGLVVLAAAAAPTREAGKRIDIRMGQVGQVAPAGEAGGLARVEATVTVAVKVGPAP